MWAILHVNTFVLPLPAPHDQRWSCDIFNRLFLSLIQLLQIVLLHVDKYREKADENFIFAFANI